MTNLDAILSKYESLKKSWEQKKLTEVERLLLDLKIELASLPLDNERVIFGQNFVPREEKLRT